MIDGLFVPGNGFCYRVDPRVKLVLILILMVALFSATSFFRPLLIVPVLFSGGFNRVKLKQLGTLFKLLRWLLLCTLLLHLLLTPGRMLWGSAWLSYDGLIRGLLIDVQLLVAAALSLLLAWTTRPIALARGGATLLAPLQRLKIPVREVAELVPLVLYFIPALQEEIEHFKAKPVVAVGPKKPSWQRWLEKIELLIMRMLDRADDLARQLAAGGDPLAARYHVEPQAMDRRSWFAALAGLVYCFILFQV